jgi:hypothetical protein
MTKDVSSIVLCIHVTRIILLNVPVPAVVLCCRPS